MNIDQLDKDSNLVNSYSISGYSTFEQNTDLPFDIEILELDEKNLNSKKF